MSRDVWNFQPFHSKPLNPPPLQRKPDLTTLEAELHLQAQHCHDKIREDLDSLHAQVVNDMHTAVAQELAAAAVHIASVQSQARADLDELRETVHQLCEEAKYMRARHDEYTAAGKEANQTLAQQCSNALAREVTSLREEASVLERLLKEQMEQLEEAFTLRMQDVETNSRKQIEAAVRTPAPGNFSSPQQDAALADALRAEVAERERLMETVEAAEAVVRHQIAQLQEGLQSHAAVSDARFRESQAAVAELEQRKSKDIGNLETRLTARCDALEAVASNRNLTRSNPLEIEDKLADLASMVEERVAQSAEDVQRIGDACREELAFAHSAWARIIDWAAEVDVAQLERDGKLYVSSPSFSAAGLRSLQLHLRLQAQAPKGHHGDVSARQRWMVGAFLQASAGDVSFRLQVGDKSLSFAAEFGKAPEWGSQRLTVLDNITQILNVRLEIMDISAPITGPANFLPPGIAVFTKSSDAAQAAAREAAGFRSSMVRRIEWRVSHVSERVAAARAAANSVGHEDLEPIISPPFAAAGFEGLQFYLYPLGYRPKGDEMCGFFLLCPKGMHVKCKAFVGDAFRNFEHIYEAREPYGRANFCRLADKADGGDAVVCGVELQEVRMEHTLQIRPGPFGNASDQLKLVSQPPHGGMEMVREIKENSGYMAKDDKGNARAMRGRKQGSHGQGAINGQYSRMNATKDLQSGSRSLPLLLPQVGSNATAGALASGPLAPDYGDSNWR
eukprot:TRINITY_DN15969_c0_g1_i1.p1 TRINITY_DN15969_c0_g1~~TRINITY_DN15969_c0_g1_i1.p1  ORF type:complete len:734 (-),score=163.05 TRINITY_DN15969_c0_g1_i1:139-2340(-)